MEVWPPVLTGIVIGVIGFWMTRAAKGKERNPVVRAIGWVLLVVGIAIVISTTLGFPMVWTLLAWICHGLGVLFGWISEMFMAGERAIAPLRG